tara:strand:+ start:33510 stop:35924 length:2415 start_codon:yes stop_codon:yes gene_type:complete
MQEKKIGYFEEEEPIDVRNVVFRYLRFWPWFLLSVLICIGIGFLYLRYANVIYATQAKVKIMDNKGSEDFSLDVSKLISKSSINLENEIAAFNSYRLSERVVRNLGLHITYQELGTIKTTHVYDAPFRVQYMDDIEHIREPLAFMVRTTDYGYEIVEDSKVVHQLYGYHKHEFKVYEELLSIEPSVNGKDPIKKDKEFKVTIRSIVDAALDLTGAVDVSLDGEDSDVLQLKMQSTDKLYAQEVINNLIEVYAKDGVLDRQQVSLRTIEFVDERFTYLRLELDSIEKSKKNFKERNSLSFMDGDVQASIQKRLTEDNELKVVETQLLLAELLAKAMEGKNENGLLPSDLGLNNIAINQLVEQYNSLFLEFDKIGASAGENNPTYKFMEDELENLRRNINLSVKSYVNQLKESRIEAQSRQEKAQGNFKGLPEKEQILRNIERQQNLKESLYLLLLQKREEAAINLAVTVPNIKVIDYAITAKIPIAPKGKTILFGALGIGLLIPFGILYLSFVLDTKINGRDDIERLNLDIPLVGEIPFVGPKSIISDAMDRSVMSEAFKITGSNINYKLGQRDANRAKVIFVTSSMKGEGKTFTATNLALSYAYLNKRVLLMGVDLRNPQIHKYFDLKKSQKGVSDYLTTPGMNWKDYVCRPLEKASSFDVMLAGSPSLNPAMLLANEQFDELMAEVVGYYDYIVVDTAPTLLVSDTHMIAENADLTVHVLRAAVTEKTILEYTRKLKIDEKLKNMVFVLNSVGKRTTYGYSYGYGYGYNYGYGYGYGGSIENHRAWFLKLPIKLKKAFSSLFN